MAEIKTIKKLFSFVVPLEKEIEEVEVTKNEEGNEVSTKKKVKKNIDQKFFVRKPTRSQREEGQLHYWVKHSECIKAGVLPKALLIKRLDNDNGILSEQEKKAYEEARTDLIKQTNELERLNLKNEPDRTEEEKKKYTDLIETTTQLQKNIQDFEYTKAAIFDGSAEIIARDKTIMWWVLNLAYRELENGENECIFGNGTLEERTNKLDEIEELEDQWLNEVVKRFIFYVTIWFVNPVDNEKQFNALIDLINKNPVT